MRSFFEKNADFLKKKEDLFGGKKINVYFCIAFERKRLFDRMFAEIAQLVEHNLAKVGVASSSLVFRSHNEQRLISSPGGGMVDALVSGASVERRAGSSPVLGTERFLKLYQWRGGGIGRRATLRG